MDGSRVICVDTPKDSEGRGSFLGDGGCAQGFVKGGTNGVVDGGVVPGTREISGGFVGDYHGGSDAPPGIEKAGG